MYNRDRTDTMEFKVRTLHKLLLEKWHSEKKQKFCDWVSNLNKLDYFKATRSFYAELRSRSNLPELIGPVRDASGSLSTDLTQCLRNWQDYYENLYKKYHRFKS